jgi:CubicO group peptidase (beta-lactamase class C family)
MADPLIERGAPVPFDLAAARKADGLQRANPSALAVDADAVVGFLNDVDAAGLDLHSFMLHRNGYVIAEGWRWPYRPDRPRNLHSAVKSFTACAIALALEDGLFRLDDKVISFFPEALPPEVGGLLAAMTIDDLLTMQVGHEGETSGAVWRAIETSWIAEFFKIPIVQQPGTAFVYTSAASYMLSAIITRVTGETLHDYLKPRIFQPLGIENEHWDMGPDGINPGGNGLSTKTADLLKLGILHAQNGLWEGRRLLPASWIAAATRPHDQAGKYGYHWWTRPNGSYSAIGKFVQMATVFPKHGATLAVTAAIRKSNDLFSHIERHFPAALGEPPVNVGGEPRNAPVAGISNGTVATIGNAPVAGTGSASVAGIGNAADARLATRLAAWQSPDAPASWKTPYSSSGTLQRSAPFSDETIRFSMDANAHGITRLQFDFAGDTCTFSLTDANGDHVIPAGFDRWIESRTDMPGSDLHHGYCFDNSPVVARAVWRDAHRLEMTWIFAETAFRDTVVCEFQDRRITFKREVNINSGATRHDDVHGRRTT